MPVAAAGTYNPGPSYTWASKFTPDYAPTTILVRDGSQSFHGGEHSPQRKLSQFSLHIHTTGHVRSTVLLPQMQTPVSIHERSIHERRDSGHGTATKRRSSKSSLYAAKDFRRSSHSTASRLASSLPPGACSPSTKSSSRASSSSSGGHLSSTSGSSATSATRRSHSSRSTSRTRDTVHHNPAKHRHTHREHKSRPEYGRCIESGEIVRVDAPITPFVPGTTSHPRTGPPASMYNVRRSRSVKSFAVEEPKPKRTLAQRLGLKRRGMPKRPISAYRGRHHYPQHHGQGLFHHAPTHHSRPSHHAHGSSGSGWKFWKKGSSHHSSSSGWKGWFGKKHR